MTEASSYSAKENIAEYDPRIRKVKWNVSEKIVISGISGRYPESNSVEEFSENLYNKIDMVTEDSRRFRLGNLNCFYV